MASRAIPIVVGVGDIKNGSQNPFDAIEPFKLMLKAISQAIQDTHLSSSSSSAVKEIQSQIDHIGVINTWTWNYSDLPGLIAENLGVKLKYKVLSHHGGDSPAKLFDEAARRIAMGESKVAVVTGGEALASLSACAKAGKTPPDGWTRADGEAKVSVADVTRLKDSIGTRHSIGLPIHVYPLYENGFRAKRGQTIKENNQESAELYAEFAKVAEENPLAWNYGKPAATEEVIGTVSKSNRMICFPYPLLMNAFNNVNLAGACLLTSTHYAKELGIPEDRWIYPLGGAGTSDSPDFWKRPNYYSSPAISRSLDEALRVSHLKKEQIDLFDFYSCFPIVPKLACQHLGFPFTKQAKPITLLGGLTSFGGAGNNYSMHAITEMVRKLRKRKEKTGLVLANGGVVTYQYVICLSSIPRTTPYPDHNPLPDLLEDETVPEIDENAEGEAVIETYTIQFSREGNPDEGYIVGRLKRNNHRFLANHGDEKTLVQLASREKEQIGRSGWVRKAEDGRNLFVFERGGNL